MNPKIQSKIFEHLSLESISVGDHEYGLEFLWKGQSMDHSFCYARTNFLVLGPLYKFFEKYFSMSVDEFRLLVKGFGHQNGHNIVVVDKIDWDGSSVIFSYDSGIRTQYTRCGTFVTVENDPIYRRRI